MARQTSSVSSGPEPNQQGHAFERGQDFARNWLDETHPQDVQAAIGWLGWSSPTTELRPWQYCLDPFLGRHLESQGRAYTFGFASEVRAEFQAVSPALAYLRHHRGIEDGRRWAAELATEAQILRLKCFATDPTKKDIFVKVGTSGSELPAFDLAAHLVEPDPGSDDIDGKPLCERLVEFWQPFSGEPTSTFLALLPPEENGIRHKFQDPQYVAGFVDGALGISEKLCRRMNE